MPTFESIGEWSLALFGLTLFAAQWVAYEVGRWFARRRKAAADGQAEGVGAVVGGMFALLAFVLALTLTFANTRFDERRQGTLAETNAIGTAWLRAQAIGHPRGVEIARLLEDYTKVRMAFVHTGRDQTVIDGLTQQTNKLQSEIWGHLAIIVREQPSPVSASLMASLNDTFDMSSSERFAYDLELPPQILSLLIGMAILCTAALGYQLGLRAQPVRTLVVLLTFMWTVVIVGIIDLASPRLGTIRTRAAVYEWTLQSFKGGLTIPPLPNR